MSLAIMLIFTGIAICVQAITTGRYFWEKK